MSAPSTNLLQKSRTPPKLRPSPRNSSQEGTPFNASSLTGIRVITSPVLRAAGPSSAATRASESVGRESGSSSASPPRIGPNGRNPRKGSGASTTAMGKGGNAVPPAIVRAPPPPVALPAAATVPAAAVAPAPHSVLTASVAPVRAATTSNTAPTSDSAGATQRIPVVDRAGPAREIELQRYRLDEDKLVSKKAPVAESSPLAASHTQPSPAKRRAATLPESPSSPSAGRRSNLRPTHAFHLAANTDVPMSQTAHLSHLPNEFAEVNREAMRLGITVVSLAGQGDGAFADASEFRRQPAVEPAASSPPPPLNASKHRQTGCDDDDDGGDTTNATTTRTLTRALDAPVQVRHDDLDGGGRRSSAVQGAHEDDVVTCIVQVVCSERHFSNDPHFDPIALVRITRCSLQRTTVGRLLDLVHKSLNFYALRRGVVRLFSHENVEGICLSSTTHCAVLHPENKPLAAFVNTGVFHFRKPSEDRLVVLRWVEDGVPVTGATPKGATPRTEAVRPMDIAPTLSRAVAVHASQGEAPASGVVFRGFRMTRMHEGPQFLGSNWTALATSSSAHVSAAAAPTAQALVAEAHHGGLQREAIPQYQVPSRSASSASHHSTPAVSPVRRAVDFSVGITGVPNVTQGPLPSHRSHTDPEVAGIDGIHSVKETVALFERKISSAQERGGAPPPQRLIHSDSVDASLSHDPLQSALNSIVIDGVTFVPKTPKETKLAQEIAVLRDALQAESARSDGTLQR